ncbi:MAG: hypothetical protein ACM3NQ_18305 [Bacteroidales bacterium]
MKRCVAVLISLIMVRVVLEAQSNRVDDQLLALLDKATSYASDYVKALSSVVSEERYEQDVQRLVNRGSFSERQYEARVLVSDYLLVQVPGTEEWMPFRDVYSVDGRLIHNRSDRLLKLFLEPKPAWARANEIRDESSRFNIGGVTRDINVPTYALQFLRKSERQKFAFRDKGRERLDGVDTAVIEYEETARPTSIVGAKSEDVPASGRFWIEPESGAVMRTLLETRPSNMKTRITVNYRYDETMKILVPAEMNEYHDVVEQTVKGKATYSKFRRFKVETTIEIK